MTEVKLHYSYDLLYSDTCIIIEEARNYAYRAVNIALTLRNWQFGERIARVNLDGAERAEYGKKIITELSRDLTNKYGKGFDRISLYNYLKFYRCFPEIVGSVSQQSQIVDAVSQQSENGASMRSQFGIPESLRPSQVSHLFIDRGATAPRDRTAKTNLFRTKRLIKENSRK